MIDQAIQHEIAGYKSQLAEFLSRKFIDQSLILGFTTVIQGKFHAWILADVKKYHSLYVDARDSKQVDSAECTSIDLLRFLWSEFHHPIVKSYQKQHAEIYAAQMQPTKNGKKGSKVVEMRKLNDLFGKYVKAVKSFYTGVMVTLCTQYSNPLIPQKYLQEFEITIPSNADEASFANFHSTLSYITFLCLVGLGNVTRNWAQVRIAYVDPCVSGSAFTRVQKQGDDKSRGKTHYIFPLLCYSKCIGLLPTMHEPYNHIGVIYNSLGQKFSAVLWFLRSQFTRDTNVAVGRRNLIAAFTRPWLEDAYTLALRKTANKIEPSDANVMLLRIIGDYFYQSAFRKSLYAEKAESDFLAAMFFDPFYGQSVKTSNTIAEHVTVLICFYEFAVQGTDKAVRDRFGHFLVRYVTAYLAKLKTQTFEATEAAIPLKNVRLILAFVRKNNEIKKVCGPKFLASLVDVLNAVRNFDGEETKAKVIGAFVDGKAPVRSHYFSEDIHFKDFTPIGCQFKDFEDTHLFESGNIHLLFGSYFYETDHGIPAFLDNEAVLRINKEVELASGDKFSLEKAVASVCSRAENTLRFQAIVVLVKSVFGARVHLDSEKERFEVETLNVPKTQKKLDKPKKRGKKKDEKPRKLENVSLLEHRPSVPQQEISNTRKPAVQVGGTMPSSLEEIESMILGHAPKLVAKTQDHESDAGLADMVSAIVSEDEMRDTATTTGETVDFSNDGVSKSTESSRVEPADYAHNVYVQGKQALQSGPFVRHQEPVQNVYGNTRVAPEHGYPVTQDGSFHPSAYMHQHAPQQPNQQQQQWFAGFHPGQIPPDAAPYANMPPQNAYPSTTMPQQNGMFYPGVPQYHTPQGMPQGMPPIPGNAYGVYPPAFMMPQFAPNTANQQNQGHSTPYGSGNNVLYPQYSSQ